MDSGPERLLDAIASAPEPPCLLGGGCPYLRRCATGELACAEFYAYTRMQRFNDNHLGQAHPTHALYVAIYQPAHGGVRHRGRSVYHVV